MRVWACAPECVFKINRPCDEQPVPCWKYILWNTTVLCRNLAKHWLGSIELRYTLRNSKRNSALQTPPLQPSPTFQKKKKKSLSTVCLNIKRQTQISQSLYLHKEEEEEAQKPAESVLQSSLNAPPHRDWMPHNRRMQPMATASEILTTRK